LHSTTSDYFSQYEHRTITSPMLVQSDTTSAYRKLRTYFDVFRNLFLLGSVSCEQFLFQLLRVLLLVQVLDAVLVFHLLDTQVMYLRQLTPFKVASGLVLMNQRHVSNRYLLSPTYDFL